MDRRAAGCRAVSWRRPQGTPHAREVIGAPAVLVFAPPELGGAVVEQELPSHGGVRAVAVLALVAHRDPLGLHRATLTIDELDLHVATPTSVVIAVVLHPAARRVEPREATVLEQPPHVEWRPPIGSSVLRTHEAEEARVASVVVPGVAEDVLDPPTPALALDLPPHDAARMGDACTRILLGLHAVRVMTAARTPRAVSHGVAVDGDLLAMQYELAGEAAQLIEVRVVERRGLA